jgi:hypothetical protein
MVRALVHEARDASFYRRWQRMLHNLVLNVEPCESGG